MKYILILLIFFSGRVYSQAYIAHWVTLHESNVKLYTIDYSRDNKNWTTLQSFPAINRGDTNRYQYTLPGHSYYYRLIVTDKQDNLFYIEPIFVTTVLLINITNLKVTSKEISWTSNDESRTIYYIIEESIDGIHFVQTALIPVKGNSNYINQIK